MNRDIIIRARVTEDEMNIILEKALKSGRNVSELIRDSVLDKEIIIIPGLIEIEKELRYQGNNINQLTILARQGRISLVNFEPYMEVVKAVCQSVNSCLSHVR